MLLWGRVLSWFSLLINPEIANTLYAMSKVSKLINDRVIALILHNIIRNCSGIRDEIDIRNVSIPGAVISSS